MRPVLALTLLALLSACGQKGPLYLPQKKPAVVRPAPPPAAAPATATPPKKPADKDQEQPPQP
jgi:predicted small lipoprotein YifL